MVMLNFPSRKTRKGKFEIFISLNGSARVFWSKKNEYINDLRRNGML